MNAAQRQMPIVHFVGSIPLPDGETVFRTLAAAAGPYLKRLPDGETGFTQPVGQHRPGPRFGELQLGPSVDGEAHGVHPWAQRRELGDENLERESRHGPRVTNRRRSSPHIAAAPVIGRPVISRLRGPPSSR